MAQDAAHEGGARDRFEASWGSRRRAVLAASDLSAASDVALLRGAALAQSRGTGLRVCHIVPTGHPIAPLVPHEPIMVDGERLSRAVDALDAQSARLGIASREQIVLQGSPAEVLRELAARERPAVLALGASHELEAERWLTDSTLEELMKDPPCDVLVARDGGSPGPVIYLARALSRFGRPFRIARDAARDLVTQLWVLHGLDRQRGLSAALSVDRPDARLDVAHAARSLRANVDASATLGIQTRVLVGAGAPSSLGTSVAEELSASLVVVARSPDDDLACLLARRAACAVWICV